MHRGLGASILRAFLRTVVFAAPDVRACILDPDETNTIAIRAYEKVGVRYLKTVRVPEAPRPEHIMRLERGEFV